MSRIYQFYQSVKLDAAALITLAAILIKIIAELTQYLDVLFLDDSFYMMAGVKFFELPYKAFGQLYRFRFWLMHQWEPDLVQLYYLNYKLSLIVAPLLLYVFLRRIKTQVLVAFFITFFFSISHVHMTTWPRVSHMCIEIILLAMIGCTWLKSDYYRLFVMVLTAFFLSYIRNEFFLSFVLLLIPFMGWSITKIFKNKQLITVPLLLIIGGLYFVVTKKLGNPMVGDGAGRAVIAFGQHFAYNYVTWNNLPEPFWVTWIDIMQRVFGDLVDFKTAFKENQAILIKHVFSNIKNFLTNHLQLLGDLLLPNALFKFDASLKIIISGIIFIFLGKKFGNKDARKEIVETKLLFTFVVLLVLLIPTFIASILIYPRDHYLIMQMLLVLVLLAAILKTIKIPSINPLITFILFLVAFLISPGAEKFEYFNLLRKNEGTPNRMAIQKMNEIYNGIDSLVVFEHEGGLINFIEGDEKQKRWLSRLGMDTTFIPYIEIEAVNVIYHTDFIFLDPKIANDSTWSTFIENPEEYGFVKVELENSPKTSFLLLRKDLIKGREEL